MRIQIKVALCEMSTSTTQVVVAVTLNKESAGQHRDCNNLIHPD